MTSRSLTKPSPRESDRFLQKEMGRVKMLGGGGKNIRRRGKKMREEG